MLLRTETKRKVVEKYTIQNVLGVETAQGFSWSGQVPFPYMVTTYAIWLTTKVINVDHMNTQRKKRWKKQAEEEGRHIFWDTIPSQPNIFFFFYLLAWASTTKNKLVALLFFFFYFFSETNHLFPVPPRPSHKNTKT